MFESFEIKTIFRCDGIEYCLSGLNNRFYSVYFEKNEDSIKIFFEPKQTLTLLKFAMLIDMKFQKDFLVYENSFYNQITSREYLMSDIKEKEKPFKIKNSDIKPVNLHYGKFKSYGFTRIKINGDETVIGSLDESQGFTVFGFDTVNNLLVVEKEVLGLKINKEMEILNVKCYTNRKANQFYPYFKELGLKRKTKNKQISLNLNFEDLKTEETYSKITDFKNSGGDIVNIDFTFLSEKNTDEAEDFKELKNTAEKISECGLKTGVIISPFIFKRNSYLYGKFENSILKNKKGKPLTLNDGFLLDIYSEQGKSALKKIISLLKEHLTVSDFVIKNFYIICAPFIPGHTRGETCCYALNILKKICSNSKLCVSGGPLVPCVLFADTVNLGLEATERWRYISFFRKSSRHAVISSLYNALLNEFFVQYQSYPIKQFEKSGYDAKLLSLVAAITSDDLVFAKNIPSDPSFGNFKNNEFVVKSVSVKNKKILETVYTVNGNHNRLLFNMKNGKILKKTLDKITCII